MEGLKEVPFVTAAGWLGFVGLQLHFRKWGWGLGLKGLGEEGAKEVSIL